MKPYKKRSLIILILTLISFSIPACNPVNQESSPQTEDIMSGEAEVEEEAESALNNEAEFDSLKTIEENIDTLNNIVESRFEKSFSLVTFEDYEITGQSDWILILKDDKVGIDLATWKYDYDQGSDDSQYLEAVLTAFIFFYGDDMGYSLWSLTGDLYDGGADERLYGFTHEGGKAIYKDGSSAIYEPDENDNFYIWLTPEG